MSLHYSPQIITDGLIFYLDPINLKSYSGTGNSFTDLTQFKSPGTLSATNLFDKAFNSTGTAVISATTNFKPLTSTQLTISITLSGAGNIVNGQKLIPLFISAHDSVNAGYPVTGFYWYGEISTALPDYTYFEFVGQNAPTSLNFYFHEITGVKNLLENNIVTLTITADLTTTKLYINSTLVSETTVIPNGPGYTNIPYFTFSTLDNALFIKDMYYYRSVPNFYDLFNPFDQPMNIYNCLVYNKVLNPEQVAKNYNTLTSRYKK